MSGGDEGEMEDPKALFERALAARGLAVKEALPDGSFVVASGEIDYTVNLDNTTRDYQRDRDPAVFDRLVDLLVARDATMAPWEEIRGHVYYYAVPADLDFEGVPVKHVSREVARIVVHDDEAAKALTWITESMLDEWGIDHPTLNAAAAENLARQVRKTEIEIQEVAGHRVALLVTATPFKASFIFSPAIKELVGPELGWPVFAVIPCRDFALIVPDADADLLGQLGPTVVREFKASGHPISTEVLHITDEGIEAIGAYERD